MAVVDQGVPIYEFGVAELLRRSGLDVTESDQPLVWASKPGNRVLVIVMRTEDDWLVLQGLAQIPGSLLVAVVVKPDLAMYRRALEHVGALAAIAWNAQPNELVKTVTAAAAGDRLLPQALAQALLMPNREPVPDWYGLDAEDLYLIRALRAGDTQVSMARHLDRSDRSIRSKLTMLHKKLGVRNSAEAIVKSANWNLEQRWG